MKLTLFSILIICFGAIACTDKPSVNSYMGLITADDLKSSLSYLASDQFQGREGGTANEKAAADYLASSYKSMDGTTALNGNYFQLFQFSVGNKTVNSQNVIAFIEGSDAMLKNEAIIFVAHYDHLGKDTTLTGDQIYNGAADDGSGTVALLQIAKSFAAAVNDGFRPTRSILFLHAGAEEKGMRGSSHYVNFEPLWPLDKTTAVINMDGVGGFDTTNLPGNTNYVYILHADSTSSHLFEKAKEVNTASNIKLDLQYPKNASRFASDHIPFAQYLVPAIYFSTGLTENYHQVNDEANNIDYDHMAKITKLVFGLGWDLAFAPTINSKFDRQQYAQTGKYFCPPCGCGKDNLVFEAPGICDACGMAVRPVWEKK